MKENTSYSNGQWTVSRNTTRIKYALRYVLLIVILLSQSNIRAQKQDSTAVKGSKIVAMARVKKNGTIMLRWAVTTPKAWRKLNKYGYVLKRHTIIRNGTILAKPIEQDLGTFKPLPLEQWMPVIEENDNVAMMAQSLYGESFDVEGMDKLSIIVNLSEEQTQRFSWGLYSADQDYQTAQMAGLGYIDDKAEANEKYLYEITSLVPQNELAIEKGGVFVGAQDYDKLPKPLDLTAMFTDAKAMLSWNYAIHKQLYNSYFVERSLDSITFNPLNKLPLTSLNNSEKTDVKRMFYLDSVVNDKKYYYRVLGRTIFGERSPPSEVVSGKAIKVLEYVPQITNKNYLPHQRIILEWDFLKEGNQHIKGFQMNRSDKVDGTYEVVVKDIPARARKVKYDSLQSTNYITITALGKNGSNRTSLPALVQPVDSIPPVKPIGFEGEIDSLGIVSLKWMANKEKDMLGYRVYRGNNEKEEYSQITVSPHQGTVYYDSISVKNLNSKVYYKLTAVDKRFNMSEYSDILAIKKPDFIKPTQPVFKSYKIKDGKVHMSWANSSSEDVVKHEVYRKEKNKEDWGLVFTLNKMQQTTDSIPYVGDPKEKTPTSQDPIQKWIDGQVEEKKQYSYTIIAIDDSELESEPASPLTVIIPKTSMAPPIKGLASYTNPQNGYIEIFWKPYEQPNVSTITLYKGLKNKPITIMKNVPPTTKRIVDEKVKPNNEYSYMIRAVFTDGSISKSSQINVKY